MGLAATTATLRDQVLQNAVSMLESHHIIAVRLPLHFMHLHFLGQFQFFSRSLCSLSQFPGTSLRLFLNLFYLYIHAHGCTAATFQSVSQALLYVSGLMWRHCLDQRWLQPRDYAHDVSPALALARKAAQVKPAMTNAAALEPTVAPQLVLLSRRAAAAAASPR